MLKDAMFPVLPWLEFQHSDLLQILSLILKQLLVLYSIKMDEPWFCNAKRKYKNGPYFISVAHDIYTYCLSKKENKFIFRFAVIGALYIIFFTTMLVHVTCLNERFTK